MTAKIMRPIVRGLALAAAALVAHAVLPAPAGAECLPCVYVRNDNPYVYVKFCPPV